MKNYILKTVFIFTFLTSITSYATNPINKAKKQTTKVALLLDTSSSMDGLINQAKAQLWEIINELSHAKCEGKTPKLEIALYEYGNSRLSSKEGYIRQVLQFTSDLDAISEQLFSLTTNGGSEFCGQVIQTSLNELEWGDNKRDLKMIFIAGNEPFTQGKLNYKDAITNAKENDITVNTIFCGNYDQGVSGMWQDGAAYGGGDYMTINHNKNIVHIVTPYDNDIIILRGSDTVRVFGYRGKLDFSGSYAYSISSKKAVVLLNKTKGLHPAQSGLGAIVGFDSQLNRVLMPAYDKGADARFHLYSVSLESGLGRKYKRGKTDTIDWFVDGAGNVLAREDYDNKRQLHRIYSYLEGTAKIIYEKNVPQREITIDAVSTDEKNLIFIQDGEIFEISLTDGLINKTPLNSHNADIQFFNTDLNRKLVGVTYSGLLSITKLQNPKLAQQYQKIEKLFRESRVRYQSSTENGRWIVVQVSGNDSAGGYFVFDSLKNQLVELGREYPAINKSDIGSVTTVSYDARDGVKIPSVLTWPPTIKSDKQKVNLPLIVLPHGGPQSHDDIRFDWWAQYFASQGYVVLQPNFRGSSGFGFEHQQKGNGEWGKAMQNDISDGVLSLVDQGYVDPKRVCIVGASYGGYSAMAGGAFSPELYRCVIAVAGVSDLPRMLREEKRVYGADHWVVRYWEELIGDSKSERERLKEVSPINFANKFIAPTLLIHGKDDTVVPISQSKRMYKALKKAEKEVMLIELKGEDHWLSTSSTRLQMLKAIEKFLLLHNPV